jgi:excisionase family DNA binding protein
MTGGKGDHFLSINEIAEGTGLSYHTIRRAIFVRGELEAFKLGSQIRVTPEAFERWLERNRIKPPRRRSRLARDRTDYEHGPGSAADLDRIERETVSSKGKDEDA